MARELGSDCVHPRVFVFPSGTAFTIGDMAPNQKVSVS